jgi:hypothetical protein
VLPIVDGSSACAARHPSTVIRRAAGSTPSVRASLAFASGIVSGAKQSSSAGVPPFVTATIRAIGGWAAPAPTAAVVDNPAHPKVAWVHWFEAKDLRKRFDAAYAARQKAGHRIRSDAACVTASAPSGSSRSISSAPSKNSAWS